MREHLRRVESVLEGGVEKPPVAGLSYVPAEALARSKDVASKDVPALLAETVEALSLDFAFVPADAEWAVDAVRAIQERGRAAFWAVDGPFWATLRETGIEDGLKATAWKPKSLEPRVEAEAHRAEAEVHAGIDVGADVIVIADDVAGTSGPLVAPDYLNERLVPRYALLVAIAASAGLRSVFHSDGAVAAFLPGLARAGFIGVHGGGGLPLDRFELLLGATREQGLVLLGGMDVPGLRGGAHETMRIGTRLSVLATAGGLILTDDGGVCTPHDLDALTAAFASAGVTA
jgi:hypothetical protein